MYRNKNMLPRAKAMRRNMTPQEAKLWYQFLSKHPIHWYRQRIISSYIADFYCGRVKLAVEVDGKQHETEIGKGNDIIRTTVLNIYGVDVIRFRNSEIENQFEWVCRQIDEEVCKRLNGIPKETDNDL